MSCPRVRAVPPSCTCGRELDITVFHGEDDIGNDLCPTCSGCGCEPNERNERVSDPTDTPSTDGAPDPEPTSDMRAAQAWAVTLRVGSDVAPSHQRQLADLLDRLAARVVPEDRPDRCPNCWALNRGQRGGALDAPSGRCQHTWHDEPAGVPALDDDTRREVRSVIAIRSIDARTCDAVDRACDLLAAAYLGGTER